MDNARIAFESFIDEGVRRLIVDGVDMYNISVAAAKTTSAFDQRMAELIGGRGGCSLGEKGPRLCRGPFALLALFDDGLGARLVVLLLDDGRTIRRLMLLDDGGPIAVTIMIASLANCDARTDRPGPDAHTDFLSESWSGESSHGRKYQSIFHDYLLCYCG
jgi:hypothetical protein